MGLVRSFLISAILVAAPGYSDTLDMRGTDPSSSVGPRPARGMSMDGVERDFGPPTARRAAVGEPPITRWEYPTFTVYFEYQFVIHAVANR